MRTPDTIPELRDSDRFTHVSPWIDGRQYVRQYNEPNYTERPVQRYVPPTRSPNILLWCVAACIVWAGAYVLFARPTW